MEILNTAPVRITPEILSLIAEIEKFKGAWCAIGWIAPERLPRLRRVATIESVGSSPRIEGARLTDREVKKLIANIRLGHNVVWGHGSCRSGGIGLNTEGTFGPGCRIGARSRARSSPLISAVRTCMSMERRGGSSAFAVSRLSACRPTSLPLTRREWWLHEARLGSAIHS